MGWFRDSRGREENEGNETRRGREDSEGEECKKLNRIENSGRKDRIEENGTKRDKKRNEKRTEQNSR